MTQVGLAFCETHFLTKIKKHGINNAVNNIQGVTFLKLIIAEKPELANYIANAIPGTGSRDNGAITKGDYTIISSFGHLLTLKMPEDYDPALKKWEMETLPIFFDNWQSKPNDTLDERGGHTRKNRLTRIGELLKSADEVIHAGDPDDEGQYLIDEILEYFHYTGPVKRLATGNTAKAALERALEKMDDNAFHAPSGKAAYARSVADLMVGVNLSRYFTLNNPQVLLSIGRVQTPTLGIVAERDAIRESHQVIRYYVPKATVEMEGKTFQAKFTPDKEDQMLDNGRITSREYAEQLAGLIRNMPVTDATVTVSMEKEEPPLPFNLTELRVYCEKKWGYTPNQVLDITQSLRDKYNAISYNRSDCQYLSSDQFKEAPEVMECVKKNINFSPKEMDMSIKSRAFDDKYIEDSGAVAHLAIIPQAVDLDISKLTEQEKNVYLAICQFYMMQFMPPAEKKKTKFTCPAPNKGSLEAVSTVIVSPGYRAIFAGGKTDDASDLSSFPKGTYKVSVVDVIIDEGQTSPPPPYTQSSLIADMTRISKYVKDPEIKKILLEKDKNNRNENGSIGTEATRGAIVETLLHRGYLSTDEKQKIHITPLGKELLKILPEELVTPDLTAKWWVIQENIKHGEATPATLTGNVMEMIQRVLHTQYPKIDMSKIPANLIRNGGRETVGICPACGAPVIEGENGFGCSAWKTGCKFVLWKTSKNPMLKNVTITKDDAKKLLSGKPTHKKDLAKKAGGTFEGDLILENNPTFGYQIALDTSKFGSGGGIGGGQEVGICPRCGKPVVETKMGFSCSGYKDGCSFVIWKKPKRPMFEKVEFTVKDAKALLEGKTIHKKGLKKKAGGTFESDLFLVDDPNSQYGPAIELVPKEGGSA